MFAALKLAFVSAAALATFASADALLNNLARDVSRVESIREFKDVQRSFAHLAQFGRFHDATTLFMTNATFIWGNASMTGRSAIENFLNAHTGEMNGRKSGSLNTLVIENPVVSLSVDGQSANARWNGLRFAGDGKGGSWIEGGIYENQYVREQIGWRIASLQYYALYEGTYEDGWRNVGGRGIPVIPYHFTPDGSGLPILPPEGDTPPTNATLRDLEVRIDRLNDEDEVRNLMHAHGYYLDRRMWTDVIDLHTTKTKVTITGQGTYNGLDGVRKALERMGPSGLTRGVNNDHPIFDMLVEVSPHGQYAIARGIEIAMRVANYYKGWSNGGINTPTGYQPPWVNVGSFREAGFLPSNGSSNATIVDLERRLRRSAAYDGTENQSHAYGYLVDDIDCAQMGALFATRGHKSSPFAGFFITPQRIIDACFASYGTNRSAIRSSISFHWRPQPVILVSHDGRSATLRARLLQPSTSVSKAGSFNSAMYHDQVVLENGRWRLWSVTIDEFYWQSSSWAAGWADPTPRNASQPDPEPAGWTKKFPPDVTIAEVGEREAGFRGGAGKFVEWPEIQRMWFGYRNLVSGRVSSGEKVGFWEGCVPCKVRPDWALEANGWEKPEAGPIGNGTLNTRR
ncbi:hypothetical protein PMIN03_003551 [Paraphaeosphaeria minitans]